MLNLLLIPIHTYPREDLFSRDIFQEHQAKQNEVRSQAQQS